jgi:sterol desaturase/sphingolipid hydroxylase (fatty acid hydroxylase superfamily)
VTNERDEPNTANFWRNFAVDVAIGAAFASYGATRYEGSPAAAAALVLGTFAAWPLVEYLFHRYLMHGPVPVIRRAHALHHEHPRMTFTTPWFAHLLVGIPMWAGFAAITSGAVAALLMAGMYSGYTRFRLVHRLVHYHAQTFASRYFRNQLRAHAAHHARPDQLFGVTTSFWDHAFGTFRASPRVSPARSDRSGAFRWPARPPRTALPVPSTATRDARPRSFAGEERS